jgi:hypothetical protein
MVDSFGVPYGSRTRVAAVKGRCPRPLDERDAYGEKFVRLLQTRYVNVTRWTLSNEARAESNDARGESNQECAESNETGGLLILPLLFRQLFTLRPVQNYNAVQQFALVPRK